MFKRLQSSSHHRSQGTSGSFRALVPLWPLLPWGSHLAELPLVAFAALQRKGTGISVGQNFSCRKISDTSNGRENPFLTVMFSKRDVPTFWPGLPFSPCFPGFPSGPWKRRKQKKAVGMGKQRSGIPTSHSQGISLAQTNLRASSPTHGGQRGAQEVVQVRPQSIGATAGVWLSLVFSCSNTWRKTHCLKVRRSLCSGDYWVTQLRGNTVIILMMVTLKPHLQDRWVLENCLNQMCPSVSKGAKEGSPEVHLPSLCYRMG